MMTKGKNWLMTCDITPITCHNESHLPHPSPFVQWQSSEIFESFSETKLCDTPIYLSVSYYLPYIFYPIYLPVLWKVHFIRGSSGKSIWTLLTLYSHFRQISCFSFFLFHPLLPFTHLGIFLIKKCFFVWIKLFFLFHHSAPFILIVFVTNFFCLVPLSFSFSFILFALFNFFSS